MFCFYVAVVETAVDVIGVVGVGLRSICFLTDDCDDDDEEEEVCVSAHGT